MHTLHYVFHILLTGNNITIQLNLKKKKLITERQPTLSLTEFKRLGVLLGVSRIDMMRRGTGRLLWEKNKVRVVSWRCFGYVPRRDREYRGQRMLNMKRWRPQRRFMDAVREVMQQVNILGSDNML